MGKRDGNLLTQLFLVFVKIGVFTFGGGWAMISIIEREIVDKKGWIERSEFLDLLAVAQSLPGILAVNIATSVGDKLGGRRGSAVAAAASILPSFTIILLIAIFLTPDMIKNNHVVSSIFMGIRPAVVALIVAPVITSAKAAKLGKATFWIPILVALMITLDLGTISNPIVYIIAGGLGGFLYWKLTRSDLRENRETPTGTKKKGGEKR
ncbi:MAG: chromate transporter [Clostridium sp.]|nr:chromate transporter [Prevotella sp.]MCM1429466.1 chromate transporter [Clostridium sp.]MCM1475500.1 chromate transporter [Muribaculaceae bacterium]